MIPALVLGSVDSTTLEVIRILGRKGIPQFVVGAGRSFVSRSRWHRPLPGQDLADPNPSSLPELLARLALERAVLIPCTDEWVRAVARLDAALAARFPASLAPRETLDILLDKGRFAETVERLGVAHPRTICLVSEDEVAMLPDSAFRDAFLKPRDTLAFQSRYGVKAFRFESRAQAAALVREARQAGLPLILQEYIPGPATRYYFVNGFMERAGTVPAWFITRRCQMFPPDFGDTSHGISIRTEEVIPAMEVVKRFLASLCYRGVFDAEFKYDERDALFKILEINARPYGFIGFAARCGVDLVGMAYRDALSLPIEPVTDYEVGRHYFTSYLLLFGGRGLIQEGTLTPWTWARSWVGAYQPIFSWDDPLPAGEKVSRKVRSFFRRPT